MKKNHNAIFKLCRDRRGVASIEYVLLLAFIGAGIVAGAGVLKLAVTSELSSVAKCINTTGSNQGIC